MRAVASAVLILVTLSGCLGLAQQAPIDWTAYIDHIVDLLEENSILRYEIDWTAFRAQVIGIMRPYNLGNESERYEVLRQLFALLKDNCDVHSHLVSAAALEWNRALWHQRWRDRTLGEEVVVIPGGIDARMSPLDAPRGAVRGPRRPQRCSQPGPAIFAVVRRRDGRLHRPRAGTVALLGRQTLDPRPPRRPAVRRLAARVHHPKKRNRQGAMSAKGTK